MEYLLRQRQPGLLPLGLGLLAVLGLGLALALPSPAARASPEKTLESYVHSQTLLQSPQRDAHTAARSKPSMQTQAVHTAAELLPGSLAAPAEGQSPLEAAFTALVQSTMKECAGPERVPVWEPVAGAEAGLYLMACCVEPTGERILDQSFSIPIPEGSLQGQTNDRGSACLGPLAPGRYTLQSSLGTVVFTLAENGAVYCTDSLCRMDGEYIALGLTQSS